MTYNQFIELVEAQPSGVVLLEGRRLISPQDATLATEIASLLARDFSQLRFRSGNAQGSDYAFSKGIADIDPTRLQIISPYTSHRKNARFPGAQYDSPETLTPEQEQEIADLSAKASPKNQRLFQIRNKRGPIAAKAAYLIRDTMKVVGYSASYPKPICALFHTDPQDPQAGGTGHTIRVCIQQKIPYALQDSWHAWL